jgi:hypothetical protein
MGNKLEGKTAVVTGGSSGTPTVIPNLYIIQKGN